MATHYKGERIDELLGEIATLKAKLEKNIELVDETDTALKFSHAYSLLVMAKAKLTALQGDDYEHR